MKKSEYPFYADWFVISLRWLVLVGVAFSLALAGKFSYPIAGSVLAGVLWNFLSTMLAVLNRRFGAHRPMNVVFDFFITAILFFASEGFYGPLSWVALLNLFSAGIYFGWIGSVGMAAILSVVQILGSIWLLDFHILPQQILMLTGFNLFSGSLFGLLTYQLYLQLREYFMEVRRSRTETDEQLRLTERRRMQDLFQMVESINVSLDYKTVLKTALDLSREVLTGKDSEPDQLVSAILLFDGPNLKVMIEQGFQTQDRRRSFPAQQGALLQAILESAIVLLDSPSADPELGGLPSLAGCQAVVVLPLRRGLDSYGLMLFGHRKSGFFSVERQDVLEMISQQAAIAIQNAQLFQELETERDRLVQTQAEERKRLANELHDGPTQSVTGIAMRAAITRRMLANGSETGALAAELEQIEDLARRTTLEMRSMLFSLRPLVLETEGLYSALQTLAKNMKEIYQQNVLLSVDPAVIEHFDTRKQKVIFQIIDEAVNNASKHANASQIQIKLLPMPEQPEIGLLEVIDNGVGFDPQTVSGSQKSRHSLGMQNLKERADLINGRFHIESSPGKGTCVQVALPLTTRATDYLQGGVGNIK